MSFVMFREDPDAAVICEFFKANGVPAYVKGTGLESTGILLAGQYPVLFVEEEKTEDAEKLYDEWHHATPETDDLQEEKKEDRAYRMWVGRILLVFFIGGILFSFLSHYIRF